MDSGDGKTLIKRKDGGKPISIATYNIHTMRTEELEKEIDSIKWDLIEASNFCYFTLLYFCYVTVF